MKMLLVGSAATVAVVSGIALLWLLRDQSASFKPAAAYTPGHSALLQAHGDRFPFAPRLSGSGWPDKKRMGQFRSIPALPFAGEIQGAQVFAEVQIDREAQQVPSPEARAAVAVRDLLSGRFDRAVSMLEAEVLGSPGDSRLLNDLAVAYLVRGIEADRPLDLLDALTISDQAIHLDPERPEPRFNRAYALHMLHLRREAAIAWQAYLESDPFESSWAELARTNLKELNEPLPYEVWPEVRRELELRAERGDRLAVQEIVGRFPEASLEAAETWLFSAWAGAVASGDTLGAEAVLLAVRTVARALRPEAGGDLLDSALKGIEAAPITSSRRVLASAYDNLARAVIAIESFDVRAALTPLRQAYSQLSRHDSPYRSRSLYLLAICRYQESRYEEARRMLQEAGTLASQVGDLETKAASLQLLAQIDASQNRFASALEGQRAAVSLYRRASWAARAVALEGLIGEVIGFLGDEDQSWRHRLQALDGIGLVTRPRIRVRIWSDLTEFVRTRSPNAAGYFADELVREAEVADLAVTSAVASEQRASVLAFLDEPQGALADLDRAEAWIDQLSDRGVVDSMRATILLSRGELIGRNDPSTALKILDEAQELLRITDFDAWMPRLLRVRARNLRTLGDLTRAEADLRRAVAGLEEAAVSVGDPRLSATVLTEARLTYDELLDLQITAGWSLRALADSERGRWIAGAPPPSLRMAPTELRLLLPPEAAIVAYWSLPERLLIWVLRRHHYAWAEVPISRTELQKAIMALHGAIQSNVAVDTLTQALYEFLIVPIEADLIGASGMVVVPDISLPQIPFPILRSSSIGRYLIEDRSVLLSPSVNAASLGSGSAVSEVFSRSSLVLAVGNPIVHPHFRLPTLPQADVEVQRIADQFPGTTILKGHAASKTAVLELAKGHEIVHFAVHALPNARSPLRSSLVLAATEKSEGLLFAEDLVGSRLEHVRLVVMSACGPNPGESGHTNLAGFFLAAGASMVIAPAWSVADGPSAAFFGRFYELLRSGLPPSRAIRMTQLEFLNSSDSELSNPSTWGAYQVTSGFEREIKGE